MRMLLKIQAEEIESRCGSALMVLVLYRVDYSSCFEQQERRSCATRGCGHICGCFFSSSISFVNRLRRAGKKWPTVNLTRALLVGYSKVYEKMSCYVLHFVSNDAFLLFVAYVRAKIPHRSCSLLLHVYKLDNIYTCYCCY